MSSSFTTTDDPMTHRPDLRHRKQESVDDASLFDYIRKSSPGNSSTAVSLESLLSAKLEEFISSTMATLEEYFIKTEPVQDYDKQTAKVTNARLVYQSLTSMKNAEKTKKLEILDKILDDYYGNIFNSSTISTSQEKLLLGIEFIDAKFRNFLNSKGEEVLGLSFDNDKREMVSDTFRHLNLQFHNYDKAIESGKHKLLHYWELPFPWRENKFIVYGYRFNNTYPKCVRSILQWHNETGNIWTHMLGLWLVLGLTFYHFPHSEVFETISTTGSIYIYAFLLAAIKCLISSVCWHTFNSTSNLTVRTRFACVDYTGITVLITASVVSTEYCALYYYPICRNIIIAFSILAGALGFVFTWSPTFDTPKARPFRIVFFISLLAMGVLAFFILSAYQGFMKSLYYYLPLGRSLGSYLSGVVFYGFLFPECCRTDVIVDKFSIGDEILNELNDHDDLKKHFKVPDKTENHECFSSLWWVDYGFSSHNFWHTFVVGGIFYHYMTILYMFNHIEDNMPLA